MSVLANGNVGIGTSSPIALLSVMASSTAQTAPFIAFNSTSSGPLFNVLTNGNVGIGTSTPANDLVVIGTSTFIGGNVGIGTSNPTTALEVVGDITSKGTAWTARTAATSSNWNDVTYGNGLFVGVGSTAGVTSEVMTSPDGVNWTNQTSASSSAWIDITYGNGMFVAVSQTAGLTSEIMTSSNGTAWTERIAATSSSWNSVTYGNNIFVAVGSTAGLTSEVMTSPDGVNWTNRSAATSTTWSDVTYGNGLFVAVSTNQFGVTSEVMTSPDGITWTNRSAATTGIWNAVTYGNGLFVAVTANGGIMTSPDGSTWTSRTSIGNSWNSITYGNGLFVATGNVGGSSGGIITSPDGINWTNRTAVNGNTWGAVTYGNGIFVSLANNGSSAATEAMSSGKTEITTLVANNVFQGGMDIFGNVGIGTTTPGSRLWSRTSQALRSSFLRLPPTSGNSYFHVMANGAVGIGTSTPFASGLTVQTASTTPQTSSIVSFNSTTTTLFNVLASGNVGIGTSSPTSLFVVTNNSTTNTLASIFDPSVMTTGNLLSLAANGATTPAGLLSISGISLKPNAQTGAGSTIFTKGGQIFLMASSTTATTSSAILSFGAWYGNVGAGPVGTTTFSIQNIAQTTGSALSAVAGSKLMFSFASTTSSANLMSLSASGTVRILGTVVGSLTPDLAENIPVSDPTIEPGDLVTVDENAVDSTNYETYEGSTYDLFSAKKTSSAYDPKLLGVISTEPGIIMHGSINSVNSDETSAPNDRLLTLTGRTLVKVSNQNGSIKEGDYITSSNIAGVGMKATKAGQVIGQALEDFDATSTESTGKILVFVNSGYYNGESISDFAGVELTGTSSPALSKMILSIFLNSTQASSSATSTVQSEILTDRIAAGVEIITPQITAHGLTVDSISSLGDAISFTSDTIFFGRPYFNTDTAGFAIVGRGQKSVDVTFDRAYLEQPIVNASITLNSGDAAALSAMSDDIFTNGIQYVITNKSTNGFTILLNKPAVDDMNFSWTAFAVKNAKTFGTPSNYLMPSPPPSDSGSGSGGAATSSDETGTATSTGSTDSGNATSTDDTSATSTSQTASSTLDTTAPVITVNGSNPVNLTVGDSYTDAGATATDNIDGTVSVTSSGNG